MSENKRNKPVAEDQILEAPVEKISEDSNAQPAAVKYRVNSQTGLNLRPEPSRLKHPLRILPHGAEVEVHGEPVKVNGITWMRVENGWCDSAFLSKIGEEE